MPLLRVTSLLVQQQSFKYMRVKSIEFTRSVFRKWKGGVLHPFCSPLLGAWRKLPQLPTDALPLFLVTNGTPHTL